MNSYFETRNFNIKTCNFQFRWNLQLLTRYSLFRNLPCSTTNFLTVEADRISAALNTYGVTRSISSWYSKWLLTGWSNTTGLLHKIKFYCVFGKMFFLMRHFLVVEDYKLSKRTSHILSEPLTLERIRILSWRIFFLLQLFP